MTGATTINATGDLTFGNSSTLNFEGGLTSSGYLYLTGATATVGSPSGNATLNSGSYTVIGGSSTLTVNGNLTNSGYLYTNLGYGGGNTLTVNGGFTNNGQVYMYGSFYGGVGDTLNVMGTLTNNAGSTLYLYDGSGDVANVGTLSNSGSVYIGSGSTFKLTNQPNGITDVPLGSTLTVNGTLNAGAANGLAQLTSIEGTLSLGNGQTTADTPSGGTLTVASGGSLYLYNTNGATTLSVTGGLNASGIVSVGTGTTLNLTQGITDLPATGEFVLQGTTNGLANLTTVEGYLYLVNGQTNSITPGGTPATLTLNSSSSTVIGGGSGLTVNGNLTNSGYVYTNQGYGGGNTLAVTGGFTKFVHFSFRIRSSLANWAVLAANTCEVLPHEWVPQRNVRCCWSVGAAGVEEPIDRCSQRRSAVC